MKRILLLVVVLVLAMFAWRISGRISSDALGLAIGVVFGAMAGLPTAWLMHHRQQQIQPPSPPTYNVLVVDAETMQNYIDEGHRLTD